MKLKKYNGILMAVYILLPLLLVVPPLTLAIRAQPVEGDTSTLMAAGVFSIIVLVMFWIILLFGVSGIPYFIGKKGISNRLKREKFTEDMTFSSWNAVVNIDQTMGKIAVTFRYNPFQTHILEASEITEAHMEDGVKGAGIMRGTSRIQFVFSIDGSVFKIPTFLSNKRWKIENKSVQDAIAKADTMVDELQIAKEISMTRQAL